MHCNYRPVSLATAISKLSEHYVSSCISPFVTTADEQFVLEAQHGTETDMRVFFLRQIVSHYARKDTLVFSACI